MDFFGCHSDFLVNKSNLPASYHSQYFKALSKCSEKKEDKHRTSNMSKLERLFFFFAAFPPAAPSSLRTKKLDRTSNIARPNADAHISATDGRILPKIEPTVRQRQPLDLPHRRRHSLSIATVVSGRLLTLIVVVRRRPAPSRRRQASQQGLDDDTRTETCCHVPPA
jgi:hypothetical protein